MSDGDYSGWEIVSDDEDGSMLIQGPCGTRRRVQPWSDRIAELEAENERLKRKEARKAFRVAQLSEELRQFYREHGWWERQIVSLMYYVARHGEAES